MQKYNIAVLGIIVLGMILITSGCYFNWGAGDDPSKTPVKEPVVSNEIPGDKRAEIPTQTKPAPSTGVDFSDSLPVHFCTAEQKAAKICTMEYTPTCGWFSSKIKCIKYPCAQTYGNPCTACAAENVERWTAGECPKS